MKRDYWSSRRTEKDLAGAIITLLKDPALRQSYGEAGRARVAEHFGVD